MASRYLEFAVILTGMLLYKIFWGNLSSGAIGILIGLIIVTLILFMRKQYAKREEQKKQENT
ncbi:hypothetical protein HP398_12710 [Brevibacillus sp. HB1.4B]|uniref:hypothetical protein n=1 Tax=Brevibacillus TaxID=55080 RepID=UPI00035CBC2E|nr:MULTISPECIES: hypothetical protein [unclassified Brevibacillus]ATF11435.1 hypothetical protein A616_05330 [Brevibacillus brevis X23]NRS17293.1 hypothetical protein [Brevibacillus sp. HB1.4B]NTU30874.1 hypothetical protein [Brevibacillus sp. HB1.1]